MKKVLAIDIGASSGRFIVVSYDNGVFNHEETYRFPNGMKEEDGHLKWDFSSLKSHLDKGLQITLSQHRDVDSIGVDTWAVDYGLLDEKNNLISNPIGYRASRNVSAAKELLQRVAYQDIYQESGIQYLAFNTLFQLYDETKNQRVFKEFLLIPDLINFYLTGEKFIELTNASTTALYDPINRGWSKKNIDLCGVSSSAFPRLIYPSQKVGKLKKELCERLNIPAIEVVSVGSHDTASAVAAVSLDDKAAYLSSGTWSLLGVELDKPLINEETYRANFTNEIGLEHTVRFLKNIMGLFILQELKKDFEKEDASWSFQKMHDAAKEIKDNKIYIDVQDDLFQQPGDMLNKYYQYLQKTHQDGELLSVGQIVRSIYESMAFKYVEEFKLLKRLTSKDLQKIVVIGGGMNAKLLNQLIANSLDIIVETGEGESTVYGNALAQLIYLKEFKSLEDGRKALKNHTTIEIYLPKEVDTYQQKYQDYLTITRRK